jgi:hypothetical protein
VDGRQNPGEGRVSEGFIQVKNTHGLNVGEGTASGGASKSSNEVDIEEEEEEEEEEEGLFKAEL